MHLKDFTIVSLGVIWSVFVFMPGITSSRWWCSASSCPPWCPGISGGRPWPWATLSRGSCDTLWSSTPPGWLTAPHTCGGTGLTTRPSTRGRTRWSLWPPLVRKPLWNEMWVFKWLMQDSLKAWLVKWTTGEGAELSLTADLVWPLWCSSLLIHPTDASFVPTVVAVLAQKFRGGGQWGFLPLCPALYFTFVSARFQWCQKYSHSVLQ